MDTAGCVVKKVSFETIQLLSSYREGWDVEEFKSLPRISMNFNRLTHPRELATTGGMLPGVNQLPWSNHS